MKYVLAVVALLFSLNSYAALHKWVDAEGKVHYSDEPPPENVKSQTLRTGPESPEGTSEAAASGPAAPKTIFEREAEMKKAKKAKEEAAQKAAKQEEEAKTKRQNCEQARNQLSTLQNSPRIAIYNEAGERSFMDDATRQQRIDEAQKAVSQFCN